MTNNVLKLCLNKACIKLELKARNKNDAIRELVETIHATHRLKNFQQALSVVLEREREMTTSLENGIAIPHGKTDTVDNVLVAVGLKQSGINFHSADGQLSKIIILMLSPSSTSGPHLRCMSEIAKLLHSRENRKSILEAKDTNTVYQIMASTDV